MAGAWYVGSARWRRQWRRVVLLGLVAGIIGGAVLGALAGARRSTSAYSRLADATGSPHEVLFVFDQAQAPAVEAWLKDSPGVERYGTAAGMLGRRSPQQDWYSIYAVNNRKSFPRSGSLVAGRMPRDDRPDEAFITLRTSRNTGLRVGDTVGFRAYDAAQIKKLLQDPWTVPAGDGLQVKVVGIARDPSDAQLSPTIKLVFGTPAFAKQYARHATITLIFAWIKGGVSAEPAFERDLAAFARTLPGDDVPFDVTPSRDDAVAADHSSSAVATGLLIFALVAGLAGLVTLIPLSRRSLGSSEDESAILGALGAPRVNRALAQFVANLPFLVIGTVTAVLLAYVVSPLFPLGATRALEPTPGLRADPLVLAVGGAIWLALLAALMMLVAWTDSANRLRQRRAATRTRGFEFGSGGNERPTTVGMRFAIQPRVRRSALHRSALAGVVVAVIGVVSCLVFTKSMDDFTTTPARYGIDFNLWIELPNAQARTVADQLVADSDLTAVATSHNGTVDIEERRVEAYGIDEHKGTIRSTVRTGVLPSHDDEIALGPKLLASLHKQIGDTVTLNAGRTPCQLKIVGTALSPTSESNAFNAEAILTPHAVDTYAEIPAVEELVRVRPDANYDAVLARLDARYPYGVSDESRANPPGPVRNLNQIRRLPLVLALFFMLLGAVAVAQAILMTANERRRDISVLRVIGYTRRQTRSVLRGVGGAIAAVGIVIGVPVGFVAAQIGWHAVAHSLSIDGNAAVPVVVVTLVTLALVVFSMIVALVPARLAVRRPPAAGLQSE